MTRATPGGRRNARFTTALRLPWRTGSSTWQRIFRGRRLTSRRIRRGSALLAFDTKKDQVLWWDTMIPKEGCRCLLHDEERHRLYALSYPRDHFIIYDTKTRKRRDVGRIGALNAQTLCPDL